MPVRGNTHPNGSKHRSDSGTEVTKEYVPEGEINSQAFDDLCILSGSPRLVRLRSALRATQELPLIQGSFENREFRPSVTQDQSVHQHIDVPPNPMRDLSSGLQTQQSTPGAISRPVRLNSMEEPALHGAQFQQQLPFTGPMRGTMQMWTGDSDMGNAVQGFGQQSLPSFNEAGRSVSYASPPWMPSGYMNLNPSPFSARSYSALEMDNLMNPFTSSITSARTGEQESSGNVMSASAISSGDWALFMQQAGFSDVDTNMD